MTRDEMLATCEDARRQIAAMPEWKQRWLEQYMGKPVSRSSGSLGTLSIGGNVARFLEGEIVGYNGPPPKNSERLPLPPPPPPMSSDYTHSRILELERLLDEEWGQEDDTIGFVPRPPPVGVINAPAKPAKKNPPSTDLTNRPKRKITLE